MIDRQSQAFAALRKLPQSEAIRALGEIFRVERITVPAWYGAGEGENAGLPMLAFDDAGNRYSAIIEGGAQEGEQSRLAGWWRYMTPEFDPEFAGGEFGTYIGQWDAAGRPLRIVFQKVERSGSWFSENLEWIGPIAVAAFAYFGPGLLQPYTVADAAASQAGNLMWDEIGFDPTMNAPPGEFLDFPQLDFADFPTFPDVGPPPSPIATPAPPVISTGPGWTLPDIGALGRDLVASLPGVIKDATAAARAGLTLVQTVRAIQSQGSGYMAGGAQRIVRPDGTVLIQYPDGRRIVQRTNPGTAEQTLDGGFVVNNGDGTYTIVRPDGSRQMMRYGSQAGGGFSLASLGGNQALLIGGAILGAFLLARAARR